MTFINKWGWLGVAIAAVCLTAIAFLCIMPVSKPYYESQEYRPVAINEEPESNEQDTYLIKSNDKGIVVLHDGKTIKMLNVDLPSLPAESRAELKKGIVVRDKEELAQRLEDYLE